MSQEIIKVVVTTPLDERALQRIRDLGDRIRVDQVSPWVLAERIMRVDASNAESAK